MIPAAYESTAALLLLLGGLVACCAGYRLFRVVLGIYGFFLGAMLASSVMGVTNTTGMLVAGLVGGLIGAMVLVFAYFLGIGLLGAGLGAALAHAAWPYLQPGDPSVAVVIGGAVLGAFVAMVLQRYVIIMATAFGGAWTVLLAGLALAGHKSMAPAGDADVWILYVTTMPAGWAPLAWLALGVGGAAVQLGVTAKGR